MEAIAAPPATLGIRHIALKVRNLKAAEDFYCRILGYRVEWRPDPDNLYLNRDGDNLALHRCDWSGEGSLDHFGILLKSAADVDAWASYLSRQGVALDKPPKTHRDGARSFYIKDPEGNGIQFIHHPPISGA
ncbi:MAG: VOC family protein [Elusimicrobia bacterium]|nr:VOC family protein [Elusimicrobiota bacterium]